MEPRKPTDEEKKELLEYLVSGGYGMGMVTEEEVKEGFKNWVNTAPFAVFDSYQTDYPRYKGKVLVILPTYSLYPEIVEVYIWVNGKIIRVRNEEEMNEIVDKNLKVRGK